MSRLSMHQFALEIADSNRRVADSVEGWQPAQPQDATALRRRAARSARELTRFTLSRSTDPRAVWMGALEVFEEGLAGEESREVLQVVRDISDTWLRLAEKTRAWWQNVAMATGASPEGLEELEAAERDVKEVRAAAETLFSFITRTRAPVDPVLLQKGREEMAEGRFKSPEQMRSLRHGPKE